MWAPGSRSWLSWPVFAVRIGEGSGSAARVPALELLADLIAGSAGGELVEQDQGAGVPRGGLGRGFAAMLACTWAAWSWRQNL